MENPLALRPRDIAGANVSIILLQLLIDKLLEKNVLNRAEMSDLFKEMAQRQAASQDHPHRENIRAATAELLRGLVAKYDVSPSGHTH